MKKSKTMFLSLLCAIFATSLAGCHTTTQTNSGSGSGGSEEPPIVIPEKEKLEMSQVSVSFDKENFTLLVTFNAVANAASYQMNICNYNGEIVEAKENYTSGTVLNLSSYENGIYEVKIRAIAGNTEKYENSDWRTGQPYFKLEHPKQEEKLVVSNAAIAESIKNDKRWSVKVTYDALPAGIFTTLYLYKDGNTLEKTSASYASGMSFDAGELEEGTYTLKIKANGSNSVSEQIKYLDSDITDVSGQFVVEDDEGGNIVPDKTKIVVSNLTITENGENFDATWESTDGAKKYVIRVLEGETVIYSTEETSKTHRIDRSKLTLGKTYSLTVKAVGDEIEYLDSDTITTSFKNGEAPEETRETNNVSLQFEAVDEIIKFTIVADYFEGGLLSIYRGNNTTPIGTFPLTKTTGRIPDEYVTQFAGETLRFKLNITGNTVYADYEGFFTYTLPELQQSGARINAAAAIRNADTLEISVSVTGTYSSITARVEGPDETVTLENYANGKFTYDVSAYSVFSAYIVITVYSEDGTELDSKEFEYEDAQTIETFNFEMLQKDYNDNFRTFEVATSPKIGNADFFTYEIQSISGNKIKEGIIPLGNYLTTGVFTFAFDSDILTSGVQYKVIIKCFASDNKLRQAEKTFVAISVSEKETILYSAEDGTGTPSASLTLGKKYKANASDLILKVIESTTTKLELEHKNGFYDGVLSKIVKKGNLKTWKYISTDVAKLEVTLNLDTSEIVLLVNDLAYYEYESTQPATAEERFAYQLTNSEGTGTQAVLSINRQDYGATYYTQNVDDGIVDVINIASIGSATNSSYIGLFSDANLDFESNTYITIPGSGKVSVENGNVKNAFAGYDLLTALSRMNAAIMNNEEIYIVNNAAIGSFERTIVGEDSNGQFDTTMVTEFSHNVSSRTIELTVKVLDRNGGEVITQKFTITYNIENIPETPMS